MVKKTRKKNRIRGINLITMRMKGHSGRSGYDRLIEYMPGKHIAPPQRLTFTDRLIAKCLKRLIDRADSVWYHRPQLLCEIKAAKQWLCANHEIFHFIYGENSYQYLAKLKNIKQSNRIVCTYHTPPDKFERISKSSENLQAIDAVITVSNFQKDYFTGLLDHNRVWFVPHGIDIEYFRPASKACLENGKINCIFVGSHLRDLNIFKQVVEAFEHQDRSVLFHIVSKPETNLQFKHFTNVHLYSNISDRELLDLYQAVDILTLPLIDSTANNTILEAMACGLPIITTDLPGTRDYLSDECALFVPPGDASGFIEYIEKLTSAAYRRKIGENCHQNAQRFDWKIIADKLIDCYLRII